MVSLTVVGTLDWYDENHVANVIAAQANVGRSSVYILMQPSNQGTKTIVTVSILGSTVDAAKGYLAVLNAKLVDADTSSTLLNVDVQAVALVGVQTVTISADGQSLMPVINQTGLIGGLLGGTALLLIVALVVYRTRPKPEPMLTRREMVERPNLFDKKTVATSDV